MKLSIWRCIGLGCEAPRAILDGMAGGDFAEFGRVVGEAKRGIAEGIPWLEGTGSRRSGEGGREAGDGVKFFAFLMHRGDAFEEGAGVGVAGIFEQVVGAG